jgi:ribosomal protein L29
MPRASTANPVGASLLSLEEIRRMSPEEINRRWDEVKSALRR